MIKINNRTFFEKNFTEINVLNNKQHKTINGLIRMNNNGKHKEFTFKLDFLLEDDKIFLESLTADKFYFEKDGRKFQVMFGSNLKFNEITGLNDTYYTCNVSLIEVI